MVTPEQRRRFAKLLEDVAAGTISPNEAISLTEEWTDMPWDEKTLSSPWHALMHFQIDEDIRAKDSSYNVDMKTALLKLAGSLRSDEAR